MCVFVNDFALAKRNWTECIHISKRANLTKEFYCWRYIVYFFCAKSIITPYYYYCFNQLGCKPIVLHAKLLRLKTSTSVFFIQEMSSNDPMKTFRAWFESPTSDIYTHVDFPQWKIRTNFNTTSLRPNVIEQQIAELARAFCSLFYLTSSWSTRLLQVIK